MKRTKTIIALILALLMLLGCVSAFAAEGTEIKWKAFDDEGVEVCTRLADLSVGTNTVAISDNGLYYFDISDLENGYYILEITDNVFDGIVIPEKKDGIYEGWGKGNAEYITSDYMIFHIEESDDVMIALAYGKSEAVVLELEYCGEEITSIDFSGENYDELILYYDISEYYLDGEYLVKLDADVNFLNGKTIELNDEYFYFTADEELKSGENTVKFKFADYEQEEILNVSLITDYISDVDIEFKNDSPIYVYYDGREDIGSLDYKIIVTFADGTKQTYDDGYSADVTLSNGRKVEVFCGFSFSEENSDVYITISVGDYEFGKVKCKIEKTSLPDNIKLFRENMEWHAYDIKSVFDCFVSELKGGNIENISEAFSLLTVDILWYIETVYEEVINFIKFMF